MKNFSSATIRQKVGQNTRNQGVSAHRRSLNDLLTPLDRMAKDSPNFIVNRDARFELDGESYVLPRYLFIGPRSGDTPTRIGIFAGIHGDEPEGVYAAIRFLTFLEQYPDLAAGYCLSVYPVCNPTGFEDNTRHSRRGKDINRKFWRNTTEPETRLLQTELKAHSFHGIISLHIDDTSDGFYGIVGGATLTENLIKPALKAADAFLPLDTRALIDGFPAEDSVVRDSFPGVLRAPPSVRSRPFEIVLEAPNHHPAYLTEWAFVAALESILAEYRKFISYAQNL
ncbi:MAG: succinylglutamate desuccinylase/aspartoacylase family protein [Limisphaerales bacterium]